MCRSWLKVDPIHIRWFCCRKILKVRTTELLFFSVSLDFHSGSFTILRFGCALPRCIARALSLCWTPFVNYVSSKVWCMKRRVDCSSSSNHSSIGSSNMSKCWKSLKRSAEIHLIGTGTCAKLKQIFIEFRMTVTTSTNSFSFALQQN